LLIPGLYYVIPKIYSIIILGIVTIIFILVDYTRLHIQAVQKPFLLLFGGLLRRKELYSFTGGTYLLLASFISILIIPDRGVFMLAVLYLVVGDTVAALVGLTLGRHKIFNKSLEGTVACLISCVALAYFVPKLPGIDLSFKISVIGAITATIVEALPTEVNDNVVIPILSGTVMQLTKLII
jgi:glycerol-3-phosphate acyltransferase PlsY